MPLFYVESPEDVPEFIMLHLIKCVIEINEIVEQVRYLQMFFAWDPKVEDLFHCSTLGSKNCLLS